MNSYTKDILKYSAAMVICAGVLLSFKNRGNEQPPLTIDANGNVGIGTDQPKAKLQVAGDLGVNGIIDLGINQSGRDPYAGKIAYSAFDNGALCIVGAGNDDRSRRITMWSEGGAQIRGKLSINKDALPTAELDVNGRIKDKTGYVVPVGGIIMYAGNSKDLFDSEGSGKPNTPVEGWALCNGKNGTPNLINKFIVAGGPGSNYGENTGKIGGEATHTISKDEMPAHTHQYVKGGLWGGGDEGAHTGNSWGNNSKKTETASAGGGKPMPILPPYYSLFFIMKR